MSGVRDYPAFYVVTVNLFEILESDIDEFSSVGAVYVAGDLNGRVGIKPDYISFDANINGLNSADFTPDVPSSRASDDQTLNTMLFQTLNSDLKRDFRPLMQFSAYSALLRSI